MRLYLSSYKFGNHPEAMLEMLRTDKPKVAIIANSADLFNETDIAKRVEEDANFFKSYGIVAERLDLRHYFDKPDELNEALKRYELVWIRGANVFVLRRAMAQSGFDEILKRRLADDTIVYGGYSAGGCVLSPSLHGLEFVDDKDAIPSDYDPEIIWEGLNVIPYTFVPHYKSDHPEAEMVEEAVKFLNLQNITHKTLRDGEAIVIDGEKEELVG